MKKPTPSGLTLIELVVVLVFLGVLAVTAVSRFLTCQRDAHVSRAGTALFPLDRSRSEGNRKK
ncbi:prepilin-type N-terminal cleavage/methylation domain-containing protein [Vibrio neptunius]|uniref:Prepilin-type N-terminal cleavage/methylation domain-containing protein n=1 Tax=Vibrio neptunius TaxID=170651 RepID=A0ABS2ZZ49_9VIBR|nr:prepilin-type N-terminal cleavage/methylation domain-containing protein [Vibrio neptunius]MBN3514108.1 prepilin-type N-terminal cleavage/methylation domain-containing protein [Vibrio neptunius]MBN3549074.1 prepilin-type N-terminal cleavage/methylation domain-containing protein [Vibrio neptunius]MBN3577536.1 prepilin-type N-terminal cleavage/methylation domain-containing protein [Vibrio neptunius]MCH9871200.1 prepilin-type N-terminal cleavage/methylation domain-containing protein [Vibrio nept